MNIFTTDFVDAVRVALGDGSTPVTASKVAERVGLPQTDLDVVRACVRLCFPDTVAVRGKAGGFRRSKSEIVEEAIAAE